MLKTGHLRWHTTSRRLRGTSCACRLAVVGLIGLVVALSGAPAFSADAEPQPINLGALPLLVADDSGIETRQGLVRTVHAARTRTAPVLESDRPWEGDRVYIYGSVYADPESGVLKMWYMSRSEAERGGKGRVPELRQSGFDLVLYATSTDGVRWQKPSLGQYAFDGSRDNNIVFDLHSPCVLFDPFATAPAERYKMLGAKAHNYHAAYSADGLVWKSAPRTPVLASSDTITLSQNPATGEYLAYHKRPATVRGRGRRVVWLARSRDFQTWTEPELVFTPDSEDDSWATRPGERTEVYNMSVYPHATGFLGLPLIFRVIGEHARDKVGPGQSPTDGPIDVQLATSADGRTWQRTWPRENIIPRGAPGTFDGGAILGVSSTPVHVGDETWVYYTALNTGHGAPMPPKRLTIGRAAWRRHGFVSLDAGPDGGRLETRPVRLAAANLIFNAAVQRGRLRVALREADGSPIAGFDLDDSETLAADATRWAARWTNGKPPPTDRPVRIVIEMTNARLFSISSLAPTSQKGNDK